MQSIKSSAEKSLQNLLMKKDGKCKNVTNSKFKAKNISIKSKSNPNDISDCSSSDDVSKGTRIDESKNEVFFIGSNSNKMNRINNKFSVNKPELGPLPLNEIINDSNRNHMQFINNDSCYYPPKYLNSHQSVFNYQTLQPQIRQESPYGSIPYQNNQPQVHLQPQSHFLQAYLRGYSINSTNHINTQLAPQVVNMDSTHYNYNEYNRSRSR